MIPQRFFETPKVQALMETIQSEVFQKRVMDMGGYGVEKTGKIIYQS